eukprot:CAMPEP_0170555316 /NCGR_PEP_ID=MMETSP0211-20121228/13224_1 /TAXON_ID=311385 /ORGANISM="Pseudokeronopsis sp., Strain OXSARD2" /LENGTH=38 /DNA_ID= /DNA_START= /DNA_END= /DNA_ORIENTATION=
MYFYSYQTDDMVGMCITAAQEQLYLATEVPDSDTISEL